MKKTLATEMVLAAALLAIGVVSSIEFTAIQVSAASIMSRNLTGDGNIIGRNITSQSSLTSAIKDLTIAIKDLKVGNVKGALTEMNLSKYIIGRPGAFR